VACRLAFCGKEVRVAYSVRTKSDPGGPVLEVAGDIDSAATGDLNAALAAAIESAPATALVVIDLSQANFLDSRSIGLLAEWQARLRGSGGRMAITGARPEVLQLFTLIGLERTFEFFGTEGEAHAAESS
jgi:anti-anti-sigma factor